MAASETVEGYRTQAPPPPRTDEPAEPLPKRAPLPFRVRIALVLLVAAVSAIVVSPFGVALAPTLSRDYVMRARVGEAMTFLGEIRIREEVYRAAHYEYLAVDWTDVVVPRGELVPFTGGPGWDRLGARPDGPVRFRYRVLAGRPGEPVVPGIGVGATDFHFVMQAEADLDGDGETMAIEGYSESDRLYLSRGVGGPPLGEGWE